MNVPVPTSARRLISLLGLKPLPGEGGYFAETSRTATASSIYFLLTPADFSALHRLDCDETWHFYAGDPVEHVQFDPSDAPVRIIRMGADVAGGEQPQVRVPAGAWQGARIAPAGSEHHGYSLLGCTVSPPWREDGFILGVRDDLLRRFPQHAEWILRLTR